MDKERWFYVSKKILYLSKIILSAQYISEVKLIRVSFIYLNIICGGDSKAKYEYK